MKAGIFQNAGHGLAPVERLERLEKAIAGQGLDVVVCPELFMSGYNVGEKIHQSAEWADGAFGQKAAALAKASGTAIVYGYPERSVEGCYNAAACVDRHGDLIANHRKLIIPPGNETGMFVQGRKLTIFDLEGVTCAILICYDAEFPETVRAACQAGAQVVFVPTALSDNWPSVALQLMPTRAFENGTWLLYANHGGDENDLNYMGSSCIVSPQGHDVARAGKNEELIWSNLDMAEVEKARQRLPYLTDVADFSDILTASTRIETEG